MQVALFDQQVTIPAHIASRINKSNALADSIITSAVMPVNRISLKASRFRFSYNGEEHLWDKLKLDVVIVGANSGYAKQFYATEYSGDSDGNMPDCYSFDGKAPHHSVTSPKCASCTTCPMNQFGSKISAQGKETKACTDTKRLAVVLADNMKAGVFLLSVSPSALKDMRKYAIELRNRGIPPECIRTTLSFDDAASYPKLQFRFGGFLTEEEQVKVDAFVNTEAVHRIIGLEVEDTSTVVNAGGEAVTVVASAPAKKPVAVPEAEDVPFETTPVITKAEPISGVPVKVDVADEPVIVAEGNTADDLAKKLDALFG